VTWSEKSAEVVAVGFPDEGPNEKDTGPEIIEKIHQRVVAIAQEKKVVHGRRMRVDTTVVETDIHDPTDSTLLGDGVRVLTRAMKRIGELAGAAGAKLRDRTRSVRHCLINIGRASRCRVKQGKERMQQSYATLLSITGRVVGQAKRFVQEVASGVKRSACILRQAGKEAERKYSQTIPRASNRSSDRHASASSRTTPTRAARS
jgi:IS5 family transposase